MQEIANARRARVWCGTKSIKAQTLVLAPELLGVTPGSHCQAVLDIMPGRLREKSWWCKSRTLHTLLLKFKESEASDPRDKIYALLGITSDTQSINVLHPDYTKSFWDVVRDTSSFLFGPSDVRYGTTSEFEERLVSQNASSFCQLIISSNATEIGNSLMQQGIEVPLVEDMITAAAWNLNVGKDIITLFLHQRGNKTRIIEMLRAAAGGELERYILDLPRHPATAEPVTIFDSERLIMASLNKKRRYGIKVTEEVFRAAVGNERSGMGVMTLLFQLRRSEVEMSAVREAVAETGNYGKWSTKHIKTLQEAFASGHSTTINMLLDEIAVRDFWEFPSGVLFGALETGYMAIVNRLLGEDGGLNIGDLEGRYMTLVKLLLDEDAELTRGSMLSSLDSDELLLASYIGYAAAVKSLVASWMRAKSR